MVYDSKSNHPSCNSIGNKSKTIYMNDNIIRLILGIYDRVIVTEIISNILIWILVNKQCRYVGQIVNLLYNRMKFDFTKNIWRILCVLIVDMLVNTQNPIDFFLRKTYKSLFCCRKKIKLNFEMNLAEGISNSVAWQSILFEKS